MIEVVSGHAIPMTERRLRQRLNELECLVRALEELVTDYEQRLGINPKEEEECDTSAFPSAS